MIAHHAFKEGWKNFSQKVKEFACECERSLPPPASISATKLHIPSFPFRRLWFINWRWCDVHLQCLNENLLSMMLHNNYGCTSSREKQTKKSNLRWWSEDFFIESCIRKLMCIDGVICTLLGLAKGFVQHLLKQQKESSEIDGEVDRLLMILISHCYLTQAGPKNSLST